METMAQDSEFWHYGGGRVDFDPGKLGKSKEWEKGL